MSDSRICHIGFSALLLSLLSTQANASGSLDISYRQLGAQHSQAPFQSQQSYTLAGEYQALVVNAERRQYDDHGSTYQVGLGLQYLYEHNDDWAIWPRLMVFSGYQDNMTSDSLTWNPQLVGIRQWRDSMVWVGGVGALLHTTEHQYYPVFGLVILENDTSPWHGNLTVPQGEVFYDVNANWSLVAGLEWNTRYFQLSDPASGRAFVKRQDIEPHIGARRRMHDNASIQAALLYAFDREARLFDTQGQYQGNIRPTSQWGFQVSLRIEL